MSPALLRERDRALRSGDYELAAELSRVAGEIAASELRRMTREELEQLEPELLTGCGCEATQ
jgi:hypothetical protein